MNKIYKIVWNAARGCYVVASEIARTHQGKKSLKASILAALAMAAAGGAVAEAAVTVADQSKYGSTVVESVIAGTDGKKYEIANQRVSGDKALNRFNDFSLNQADIANLNLGNVNHQINVVNNKVDINGVVNALKDGKIGGDVYFFSSKGIAVGANGVINVGRLTLGTNARAGEVLFNGGYDTLVGGAPVYIDRSNFFSQSLAEQAAHLKDSAYWGGSSAEKDAVISIGGTINSKDSLLISTEKDMNLSGALLRTGAVFNAPSYSTAAEYRNSLVNTAGIQRATTATATADGIVLSAGGDITMNGGTAESHGRQISMEANGNLTAKNGAVLSDGGKIALSVVNSTADLQADPEAPEHGGMLIIKAANISSKTADGSGGDIEVTSSRSAMGVARVAIDDSTIDAGNTGDVIIHATANTQLYAWDIGDGAYAQVRMGRDSQTGNTISGKNVEIAARASTTGQVGEASETDAEKGVPTVDGDGDIWDTIKDFFTDTVGNIRAIGSVTKITASAEVDLNKTDINALGTENKAGDIRIFSDARSAIQPFTAGFLGFGFNVGIGNVNSTVKVDNSNLYAKKDVSIDATGDNKVSLNMMELNLLDSKVKGLSLNFSWAELHSDVSAKVGAGATISSEGNTEISATSTRELVSTVSNSGNTLSIAGAIGIADTHATAEMNGTVYAKGDVSVKAENTLAKEDDVYTPDTVSAEVESGDGSNEKIEDWGKSKVMPIWDAIKEAFAESFKKESTPEEESEVTDSSKPWNKLGVTASTALLFSENNATASVNGKVRGLVDGENGKMTGSDTAGAKSLSVAAETIARTSNVVTSTVGSKTGDDGETQTKENAVSAAVAYTQQKNKANAFISGDVKTKEKTAVTADMKIPYQNIWKDGSTSDKVLQGLQNVFLSTNLGLSDLVDSWTQTSGVAENASGAASISVVNYDNSAKAYIGKKDDKQTKAPKVDAGDVEVKANTDITTVNFAGNVADFFGENAANLFVSQNAETILKNSKDLWNDEGWSMSKAAKTGLGGAALAVRQQNHTEAYIDDGATVTSGKDATVDATTKATNIAISTAGGMAKSVAIDATVGVNRIDNDTKARIGNATVITSKNAVVSAKDDSLDVNLAGGFGVSGSTGIGASVAYNHIMRDTEAAMNGNLTAGGNVEVSAKNTGEIIAASMAGAVAYDDKTSSVNGAGSSGFHTPESEEDTTRSSSGDSGAAPAADGSLEDMVNSLAGETTNISSSSDSAISKVTSKDSSMKGSTDSASGGLAAAANVSVNRIGDNAKATVGETDSTRASITADALKVTSANDSAIKAVSGALSLNLKANQGTSIAGAFMYNSITGSNEAYVENAELTLTGNEEKKDSKDIDESLTVSATNQEKILNIAASGSGSSKGTSVAGQISLNWVDDITNAHVKDSVIKADEAVSVSASDEGEIDSYTGAVSFAGGEGTAVGASIAVNLIEGDTDANMENSTVTGTTGGLGGKTAVTAEEKSAITAIVVSGAAAGNMAGAFSGTGNWISTSTDAHVDNKEMKVAALTVDAGNHSSATLGAGMLAVGKGAAGASVAVMVNDSDVKAYAQSTNMKAEALTISADNAYNGSASDSDSDTTAKTVAVGAAGGTSTFAGSGSVTVNVISQETDAYLGKGAYDISNGDVTIDAKSTAKLFGLAGGVALSSGSGIGAAVDVQKYTGHTYGYIGDAVTLKNAGSVDVKATSLENLMSIAATGAGGSEFAGAGGAGAHDIYTDTRAFIGNDFDKKKGTSTTKVEAAKDISVSAEDTTTLTTAAGAAAAAGNAGVGLTAAVEVVDKNVFAFVSDGVSVSAGAPTDADKDSLTVKAKNVSHSKTLANGLGAGGTAGVAGAASETFVTHTTDAHVGKNAKVTATKGASIMADSDFTQLAEAGSVAVGGTAGVGLGNSTVSFKGRTYAYTGEGATVDGGTKVALDASQMTNLTYATVAGGISGTAGVNGTVGVNVLDTETKAYLAGGQVSANQAGATSDGISITASDDTVLEGKNGGIAIGAGGAGAGAAVGVTHISKDTEAFVGGSAALETTGKTKLSAKNKETLENITVQGSGGLYAGLAGAVNVMDLTSIAKAYTGDNVNFNQTNQKGGDITVEAEHRIDKMASAVGGAAVGIGSLGTAVDVGNVKTQTNAYLGNNNKVHTDGTLSINAKDHMEGISTNAIAAAVGGFGLSGSISVYNFGSTQSASDKAMLSGKTSKDSGTTSLDAWTEQEINKSQTGDALAAYDSDAISGVKNKLSTTFKSDTPELGEKGTLAMVGGGTVVQAKSVNVTADDKLSVTNVTANASAGASAAGASVSVVTTDTLTQAKTGESANITATKDVAVSATSDHQMKSTIVGASVSGGISVQGTEETWNDQSHVKAIIGKSTEIHAGGKLDVTSQNTRGFDSHLTGASVALSGAVNGAVITSHITGSSEAIVEEGADLEAKGDLTVNADADTTLSAKAIGAAVGTYAGTGTGVVFDSGVESKATVGNKTKLSGKTLQITATNTPILKAEATSVGVGIAGVGITKSFVKSTDKSLVNVGDAAVLHAADALAVRAVMDMPADTSKYNAYAEATAGAGGVLSGAVALSEVDTNQKTTVTIGSATITAKTAELSASHEDAVNGKINSISAGGVSGTGGETKTTITSNASVTIGAAKITTDEETKISANNKTTKEDKDNGKMAESVGASLLGGNGVVNTTTITHNTNATVGAATIKANASELTAGDIAGGKTTLYDKNAIAIEARSDIISKDRSSLATGAAVGAAHIKNTHNVTANTTTSVGEATLLAGDTDAAKTTGKEATYSGSTAINYDGSYKGGSIAVGSRNDATIESKTLVDVYGAAGYAGSENNVTYNGKANTNFNAKAETAKGDISVMAGRDADGSTGTISVTAHSDILNATAIPISIKKDPVATANSNAALDVMEKADMQSDRDIHLKANAGSITALGSGEVKDWVNTLADAFGAEGSSLGKKVISSSANVVMDGKANTGIHRKKSITIGGSDDNGTWTTTVTSDGDISYSDGGTTVVGAELSERLAALRKKLADFGDDEASKAVYEAEIQFLEEKMAAQGLGYFVKKDDKTSFIELPPSGKSELELAKDTLKNAENAATSMTTASQNLTNQKTALKAVEEAQSAYKDAVNAKTKAAEAELAAKKAETEALTAKNGAEETLKTAKEAVEPKATAAGTTVEAYVADSNHAKEQIVKNYTEAKTAYDSAKGTYEKKLKLSKEAGEAYTTAQGVVDEKTTAYSEAAKAYNSTYQAEVSTDPSQDLSGDMEALANQIEEINATKDRSSSDQTNLKAQIEATNNFFDAGGTETSGKFFDKDGNAIVAVYSDGSVAEVGDEGNLPNGAYYLLHSQNYSQVTRNVQIGDITAQLGDILFEGDNVSGSGTLTAGGDAQVTITNVSPNNLKVGDVKVVGRLGTEGSGQGGTIYYNDVELKGDMKTAIAKANKDSSKSVDFTVTTRDSKGSADPSITILNNFQPSSYVRVEEEENGKTATIPQYAASDTTLTGYIYNPRGNVTVSSKNGDVYTDGTIYAGTVDVKIDNGDYIQSYDTKSQSIFSVGGAPLDDTGAKNNTLGTGILANGNIFISARYVNINSTIQSGIADWDLTIPATYKLYYENGEQKVYQNSDDWNPTGHTIRVEGATGQGADKLSYDLDTGRFVVNDIEVHGGKVSIVGTIINTTNDTSKASIKALDGYGQIVIDNQSGKDIELRTLSTGEGTDGKIEITDLDRTTGKIISKTTYTRDNGQIQKTVVKYTDGKPGDAAEVTAYGSGAKVTYDPVRGAYYTLQTGQDKSYTATYELHEKALDLFGILDTKPTGQDLLNQGATITNYQLGATRLLNGGAIITDSDHLTGTTATNQNNGVQYSTKTYNTELKIVEYTQKEKRLWYTIGLAKKYDYKLVEKKSDTTLTQYSVKADYGIGIDFIGNETGGTLDINGGSGNVIVNGTLSNGAGAATLSGASITQGSRGYIDAGTLTLNATTGNAGTKDAAIRTSAETVSGSAAKDFAVEVVNHGVTADAITSGGIVSITADGDISQKANTTVTANRVELTASGAITGEKGTFTVKTAAQEGKDYGLKAQAEGNISITNTGGDLYLDSVISQNGTVDLTTNGSFVDNNYTDFNNEDAQAKLLAWGNAAVLEGSGETISKQKDQLIAKVKSKYNEFQSLKAYVNEDGVYTLDDNTRVAIASQGIDVDTYIAEKQARYDALKDTSVATWTAKDVGDYVTSIEGDDSNIYSNAAVQLVDLSSDKFLTAEEKAEVLVGSAKSAKDLLVTFAPGSIKEGITDTKTTLKGTPHVSGTAITLTSTGTDSGKTYDIGQKTEGMTIDLTDPSKLTREQILALSSAERGDFKIDGNIVTVSSVRPITAESTGVLKAIAGSGAIYLISEGNIAKGSEFTAAGEVRLKATGNLDGITVTNGNGANVVLESGSGAIKTTLKGNGVLTVRAKDGVGLKKSDGDLIVNTIYAAEGDVAIDLAGEEGEVAIDLAGEEGEKNNSLLAESREEGEETSYVNIEGVNITITNAKDMKGQDDKTTLGIKLDDKSANQINGALKATGVEAAHITLFGNSLSGDTRVQAKEINLTVAENSLVGSGLYEATDKLVMNSRGEISGGTFKGLNTNFTNDGKVNSNMSSPTFAATETLTVQNNGTAEGSEKTNTLNGAMLKGKNVVVKNELRALMNGTTFKATEQLSIDNRGDITNSTLDGGGIVVNNDKKLENGSYETTGTLTINNKATGEMEGGTFTGGNLVLNNDGSAEDGVYKATTGALTVKNTGSITGGTYTANGKLTYTGNEDASIANTTFESKIDHVEVTSKGSVNLAKVTAKKDIQVETTGTSDTVIGEAKGVNITAKSGGALNVTILEASQKADITASQSVTIGTLTAGANTTVKAQGGTLTADSIQANETATLYSRGLMDIETLEAKNAVLTSDDSTDVTNSQIGDVLSMKAAKDIIVSQSDSVNQTIMEAGGSIQTRGENANISSDEIVMTAGEDIRITDRDAALKFAGVDLDENATVTTGSGEAGSLLNGEATGHSYDVTKKGTATLTTRKGKADLTAKTIEVDTAVIGTEGAASPAALTMTVDNVAIDDLQSAADTLHVMIHGNTSENTHYAGLHNSTDGSATVKDSRVDHLNFTGNNDIGVENSIFAGDSILQTEKVLFNLWKNPGNTTAESVGHLFVHDYDIVSTEYFTRIRNGLTVNGERFPYTAGSVMNKSLFGDNYLGRDGMEKEEENTFYANELRFAEVTDEEKYLAVK